MKRSQILSFLKAPFCGRFILAYLFCLPFLFSVPVISDFLKFIYTHAGELKGSGKNEFLTFLYQNWFLNINLGLVILAVVGVFLELFFLTCYTLTFAHKYVEQKGDVFEVTPIQMSNSEFFKGIGRVFHYSFLSGCYGVLVVLVLMALTIGGVLLSPVLSTFLKVLLWIVVGGLDLGLLIWMVLNLWVAAFRFIAEFNPHTMFEFKENKQYLKTYKKPFFIVALISFVATQAVSSILHSLTSSLVGWAIQMEMTMQMHQLPVGFMTAFALCIALFASLYLCLLQVIILAKGILWMQGSSK